MAVAPIDSNAQLGLKPPIWGRQGGEWTLCRVRAPSPLLHRGLPVHVCLPASLPCPALDSDLGTDAEQRMDGGHAKCPQGQGGLESWSQPTGSSDRKRTPAVSQRASLPIRECPD